MPSFHLRLVFLLLVLAPVVLRAQAPQGMSAPPPASTPGHAVMHGVVRGEQGQPVASASVTVRTRRDSVLVTGALTSADGGFRLAGLLPGSYRVRVSQLGYRAYVATAVAVTATATDVDLGTIRLEPAPVELKGVEATAAAAPLLTSADRTVYRTRDMPVAAAGKAVDVLRGIPELEVDVNGNVTLRGNAGVAVHLNDRPAAMRGEALTTFLQQLPGNVIERVEVIPNPSAKYDPEGLGGILNIVLKNTADLGLSGTLTGNASTRGQTGLSSRLAWQQGALTFFGGAGLSFYASGQSNYDRRENLLTHPVSWLELTTASNYDQTFGMLDGTLEYRLERATTAWASVSAYPSHYGNDADFAYLWLDSLQLPERRYDRTALNSTDAWTANLALGMRRQLQPQRREWSAELRRNGRASDGDGHWTEQPLTLDGDLSEPSSLTVNTTSEDSHEWVGQTDLTLPVGARGKLDLGLQGTSRREGADTRLDNFAAAALVATSANSMGYRMEEDLGSAYLTLSVPLGRLSLQGGLRGERARTSFRVGRTGEVYPRRYASVFPSASALWDLGGGRRARLSYSKRVERPYAFYLNPDVPANDPLNRFAGNPLLAPRYTHSFGAELSLVRADVTWRLAPYFRRTMDDWDYVKSVDEAGVSTVSFANLRSVDSWGASLTASLRQTGRFGGMASASAYSTAYDATNLGGASARRHAYLSARATGSVKVSPTLDGQLLLSFTPARDIPQGHISSTLYSSVGLKQKLGGRSSANLSVMDPFSLYRYTIRTADRSHVQDSRSSVRMRSLSLSLSYSFGRAPQSARRTSSPEETQSQQLDRPIR